MKKCFWVISIMLILSVALVGCATTRDLEKVQAQEKVIDAKADQALKEAQEAKASAAATKAEANDAAAKASEAAARAENAAKLAEERAIAAEQRKSKADAAFEKSMRK